MTIIWKLQDYSPQVIIDLATDLMNLPLSERINIAKKSKNYYVLKILSIDDDRDVRYEVAKNIKFKPINIAKFL